MPQAYRERAAELMFAGTEPAAAWSLRVGSASVLRGVATGTGHEALVRARLVALSSDPVTLVRRVAQAQLSLLSDSDTGAPTGTGSGGAT